jgi:cytochrome b
LCRRGAILSFAPGDFKFRPLLESSRMTRRERTSACGQDLSQRLVWDLPVRVSHWLLALCVPLAWLTRELGSEYFRWHRYVGYTVTVLVAFRLIWGCAGTRHARLAAFVRGPRAVTAYLRDFVRGVHSRHVGHNPAGGWMVLALLGLLALQVATGLFANDQILNVGPFYGWVSPELSDRLARLHRRSFDWLLIAIGLHVLAVLVYRVHARRDLLRPMFSGRKPVGEVPAGESIADSKIRRALMIVALCAAALALALWVAPDASLSLSF